MSDLGDKAGVFLPFTPNPDRDSKPYWDALAEGRFSLQRCDACAAWRWPARAICNRCRSFDSTWEDLAPSGRIVSWVRTHQSFAPVMREAVPYHVVQVALDLQPDLLLIGGWAAARSPRAAEAVRMLIVEGEEGFRFPCWCPAD